MSNQIMKFHELNNGANAKKGFKFQDYVGIYYMLFFYKNDIDFSIYFETRDDIETKTAIGNHKVQVKSSKLTLHEIIKPGKKNKDGEIGKSIYDKLMDCSAEQFGGFFVTCSQFSENDFATYLSKVNFKIDNIYEVCGYEKHAFCDNFYIHVVPFKDNNENAEYHVKGYAASVEHGRSLNLENHINNLVKRVGELGEYIIENECDYERKKMTTKELHEIDLLNQIKDRKEIILQSLEEEYNKEYITGIRIKMQSIEINPEPEIKKLTEYKLPAIGKKKYKQYFEEICEYVLQKNCELEEELILAWAILKYSREVINNEN